MEVVETGEKTTLSSVEPSIKRSFPSIDEEVVGLVKDAENIMKKLTGGTKDLDVLAIFGMPGLGKTTLARKVYNNPSIVNHFDVKAWCSVSQTYNRRKLLIEIFRQTTSDKSEIEEDVDIADKLRKSLIGRRYLIVLDDIWEIKAWEDVGICFPKGEEGSRVVVTTRIEEVAKHLQHRGDPYSLRFLTREESWELLQKKVFQRESCPPDLLEAGLQVAEHCKGLPLVIILIAGIIAKMERQPSTWLEVANDLSSHVLGEQSMKVIQSSYEHLEEHLKPCLLYMGLFPEDYQIPVSDLVELWMAEEFVLNVDTENMEEGARVCLNDLLNTSLVMVSDRKLNGDIEHCILHDVVREFCLKKLNEENFMSPIVPYNPYQHVYSKDSRSCIYIHDDLVKEFDHCEYQLDKIPMLEPKLETECFGQCPRPLEFIVHPQFYSWNLSNPLLLLANLRLVRVLDLMEVELENSTWNTAAQSLTHLRYLALYIDFPGTFEWMSLLQDLQTLHLTSDKTLFIPFADLCKMTKLRHLKTVRHFYMMWGESSETKLENLKTLGYFRTYSSDKLLGSFPNLEELRLYMLAIPSCPVFPIQEVHTRLQSLDFGFLYTADRSGTVGRANYFVFPSNLKVLCLRSILLTEEIVSNIASLQKLESLKLDGVEFSGDDCWEISYDIEFPALKYLTLESLEDIKEWDASEASFPMLEKLVIKDCYRLKEIPHSFADIPTLQLIKVIDGRRSLRALARKIKREKEEITGCDNLQVLISKT